MKFVHFDDIKISKLCLGTVQFGLNYGIANTKGKPSQQMVNDIIDYVCAEEINCFDTAQAYGNSQVVLGVSLNEKKNNFIISKLKSELFKSNAIEEVKKSLKDLNAESLFALLLHDSKLLATWNAKDSLMVEQLICSKKIKYFGVSIYTQEDFDLAIENDNISFIQIPFNLFDQRAIEHNWFIRAKQKNKLIFIRSIFLQGLLLMGKNTIPQKLASIHQYIDKLERLCFEYGLTRSQLSLSFVDTIAKDSLLLFGCDNLDQAQQNVKNFNNLQYLDNKILETLISEFKHIDEKLYNPTLW